MGSAVLQSLAAECDIEVIHAIDHPSHEGEVIAGSTLEGDSDERDFTADVWVDVSLASPAMKHAKRAEKLAIPVLIGATGFDDVMKQELATLKNAVIIAPNLSPGINLLFELLPIVAATLGNNYDAAISETHHKHKVDQPSGTAKRMVSLLEDVGTTSQTTSLRVGEIVGEHSIRFVSEGEEICLSHRAFSRQAFASGVAPVVRFLFGKHHGRYTMADVLGIKWRES